MYTEYKKPTPLDFHICKLKFITNDQTLISEIVISSYYNLYFANVHGWYSGLGQPNDTSNMNKSGKTHTEGSLRW